MLSANDREEISRGLAEGLPLREIAVRAGRCPSVISREVRRHGGRGCYRAGRAEEAAVVSRRRPKVLAVDRDLHVRAEVVRLLAGGWSPGAVAGRLRYDTFGGHARPVSHEAIYTGSSQSRV
jgi:IS30 family transposase